MLSLTRQSRMEKAKDVLREAVSYTEGLVRDERLRSHVRSAVDHGAVATERVRADIGAGNITERLAADKKLRKNLRALIDDIDRASDRVRRKRSHRVRNAVLVVAGTGAAVAVVPNARRWVADRMPGAQNGHMSAPLAES
jgi:hypothetical protein